MKNNLELQQFLPYRCNSLAEQISISLSRIYTEQFGISIAEWRVLVTLAAETELRAKQISQLTSMDKVRVSRAVRSLTDKELLKKRHCDTDSRAELLSLNAAGNRLYKRIAPRAIAWEQSLVEPLSKAELNTFFHIVGKLEGRLLELKEIAS